MSPNFTDVCMVGAGHKLAPPLPTLHARTSVYIFLSYIFSRLRSITFSFGNVTATEIKIKLLLVLDMCQIRGRDRKKDLLPLLL